MLAVNAQTQTIRRVRRGFSAALPAAERSSPRGSASHHRHRRRPRRTLRRTYLTDRDRGAAVRSFFRVLESRCGNLPSLVDAGPAAETVEAGDGVVRAADLARLFRHDAAALVVRGFFRPASAARLGEELLGEARRGGGGAANWKVSTRRGLESSDVATLGEHPPYNVAVARDRRRDGDGTGTTASAVDEYFEGVQREFRSRRRRRWSSGTDAEGDSDHYQLWPLDKLRLELEEAWPWGAGLAREKARRSVDKLDEASYPRPFGGGLPRIMRGPTRWKRGFIHVDELGPLDPRRGLFSANIYLTMPDAGRSDEEETPAAVEGGDATPNPGSHAGGLHVWPLGVRSRWDWYRVSPRRAVVCLSEVS